MSPRSFVAQSDHRIDTRGASRGKIASQENDDWEQDRDSEEAGGVGWLDSEEHAGNEFTQGERGCDADGHTEESKDGGLSENQESNVTRQSTESHAQPELAGALADGIRGDSVDAETG